NCHIDFALLKGAVCHRWIGLQQMKDDARILPGKLIDDGRYQACGKDRIGSNPQLPYRRVGEELDVLHGLLQLIERDETAIEKRARIDRGFDALRAAIKETHSERMFHVGNRLRNGGLRYAELRSSLAHAAASRHGEQDTEVPQLEVTAETLLVPFHGC